MSDSIILDDFLALQRRVEELRREADRAAGALSQLKQNLKDDYGVKTLKEAKRLLEKFRKEELAALKDYTAKKKAFEAKWGDKLDEPEENDV
jgi:hypothetical protein